MLDREAGFQPKKRFTENIEAVRLLKQVEEQGREATDEEKATLARYNGWGGLPHLFNPWGYFPNHELQQDSRAVWVTEASEDLKKLLTPQELSAAQASVNNAHYTNPTIARAIWDAVLRLGFAGGRVLEPGMGVGNFLGLAPEAIVPKSQFFGVEKDPLTARIAKLIYPDADIRAQGFEETKFPDGMFDLVIGNVPFGDFVVYDPRYDQHRLSIHDYFIVKSLDLVRPGGVVAVVSSAWTMDKQSAKARTLMNQRAHLAAAFRLPSNAHQAQAGTQALTDVLFFVKRQEPLFANAEIPAWMDVRPFEEDSNFRGHYLNAYFSEVTKNILGTLERGSGEGGRPILVCKSEVPLAASLEERFAAGLADWAGTMNSQSAKPEEKNSATLDGAVLTNYQRTEGTLILHEDGRIYRVLNGGESAVDTGLHDSPNYKRLVGLIRIRDTLDEVFRTQIVDAPEQEQAAAREHLNAVYDAFVAKFGPLNYPASRKLFSEDPACGRVMALEIYDSEKKTAQKADIFTQRVIRPQALITSCATPEEALVVCLDRHGRIDLEKIAALCQLEPGQVATVLVEKGRAYLNPVTRRWETDAQYLSGDVRRKLDQAELATEMDHVFEANVRALKAVQPELLGPKDIDVRLGAPWVPAQDVQDFIIDTLRLSYFVAREVSVHYQPLGGRWTVTVKGAARSSPAATMEFGTRRRDFFELLQRALNQESVAVYDVVDEGNKRVLNPQETSAAQEKLDLIQEKFRSFLWVDQDRATRLVKEYNDRFNSWVPPKFDGSHMTFPGMSMTLTPRPIQKNAIWRAMHENVQFNHEVGVGKTLEQVCTAIEGKRLGKWNKPLWVTPNHMLEQAEREAMQLYPNARVLAVSKKDLAKERRAELLGKIANNNWHLVIMPYSVFGKIAVPQEFEKAQIEEELINYRAEVLTAQTQTKDERSRFGIKRLEAKVKSLEAKLARLSDMSKDQGLSIAELGIDCILVDESHNFKNLDVDAPGTEVQAGIQGSKRAWDLYMKTRFLYAQRGGVSGCYFASGTPVTNNVLEIYNLQRYLQPQVLDQSGISSPTAWAGTFLVPKSAWEPSPSGSGWRMRTRYSLTNLPELMSMLRSTMDVATAEDAGIIRPECERVNVSIPLSPIQKRLMKRLAIRVERIQEGGIDPSDDNLLKIVSEGRRLSLDPRLLNPALPTTSKGKVDICAENILAEYRSTHDILGTQLVFCDLGTPKAGRFSVYGALKRKLIELGIPAGEIAFIHDAATDEAKAELFRKVREGKIRILIGSTAKMGEGTNVQTRVVSIHDMDPPWRPSDIEQRGGRGVRFGNMNKSLRRYIYTTEDTFDMFMWHVLKHKVEMFARVLKGDPGIRTLDLEVDPTFAETAAITSSNQLIKDKLEVEAAIAQLEMRARAHADRVYHAKRFLAAVGQTITGRTNYLERLRALPEAGNPEEWALDLSRYGHKSVFRGSRQKLLGLVSKLVETQGLKRVIGITCGGAPVQFSRSFNVIRNEMKESWSVGLEPNQIEEKSAGKIESLVRERDDQIRRTQEEIGRLQAQAEEARSHSTSKYPHEEELAKLKSRQRELLKAIEEASKQAAVVDDDDDDDDLVVVVDDNDVLDDFRENLEDVADDSSVNTGFPPPLTNPTQGPTLSC